MKLLTNIPEANITGTLEQKHLRISINLDDFALHRNVHAIKVSTLQALTMHKYAPVLLRQNIRKNPFPYSSYFQETENMKKASDIQFCFLLLHGIHAIYIPQIFY